jgi:hypothetical protein
VVKAFYIQQVSQLSSKTAALKEEIVSLNRIIKDK